MRAFAAALCFGILLAASGAWAQINRPAPSCVFYPARRGGHLPGLYRCLLLRVSSRDEESAKILALSQARNPTSKLSLHAAITSTSTRVRTRASRSATAIPSFAPYTDPVKVQWFKWQDKLLKAMGTVYADEGQLRVTTSNPTSPSPKSLSPATTCSAATSFAPIRNVLLLHTNRHGQFDHFAPVSGKPVGMVVIGQQFAQMYGKNSIVYVNLGNAQGVKVGDYLRIFRYQGSWPRPPRIIEGYQYKISGSAAPR